jgi:hypothetical protein
MGALREVHVSTEQNKSNVRGLPEMRSKTYSPIF